MDVSTLTDTQHEKSNSTTGYYRSSAFAVHHSLNPLVACASPLLTFSTQVHTLTHDQTTNSIHSKLAHELQAFVCQAENRDYTKRTIENAHYVLCAYIDDCLIQSEWGQRENWRKQSLVKEYHATVEHPIAFFLHLERACDHISENIDFLELCYLILTFGFLQNSPHEVKEANDWEEKLYHHIHTIRGQQPLSLLIEAEDIPKNLLAKPKQKHSNMFSFTNVMLVVCISWVAFGLYSQRQSTNYLHNALAQFAPKTDSKTSQINPNNQLPSAIYSQLES